MENNKKGAMLHRKEDDMMNKMKNKAGIMRLAAFCMAFILVLGNMYIPISAKSKGYKFTYKKVTVYMGGAAKKLIKKAGTPVKKTESTSCAYNGKDRVYQYKDFILYTYSNTDKGPEYVSGITFLTSNVKTKEGIKIGSSLKKVKKKYGTVKESYGIYTYKKGDSKIQIEVTNNKVTNIRYIKAK